MRLESLVRPNILSMKQYSSARDEFNSIEKVTLLDANESPYNSKYNRYPDPYQRELKSKISQLKNVSEECVFLGNGSDEAIDLIFRIFCEPAVDNVMIPDPTYGMYEVAAAIQNVAVKRVPLSVNFELEIDNFLDVSDQLTKAIFLCNPNNPTGNIFKKKDVISLLQNFKGIVVIDEAYIDFSSSESFVSELNNFQNLIVLQTFSKAWGMAGLRLGMAFSSPEISRFFNKVKAPYNLSSAAQLLALDLIERKKDETKREVFELIESRNFLTTELSKIPVIDKIYHSETNFLLVKFKNHQKVFNKLIINSLIVRDRSKALNCNGCLRITIGTPEENKKLIKTLKAL